MCERKFEWPDEETRDRATRLLYRLKDNSALSPAEIFLLGQITGILLQQPPSVSRETIDKILNDPELDWRHRNGSGDTIRKIIADALAAEGITVEEKK